MRVVTAHWLWSATTVGVRGLGAVPQHDSYFVFISSRREMSLLVFVVVVVEVTSSLVVWQFIMLSQNQSYNVRLAV